MRLCIITSTKEEALDGQLLRNASVSVSRLIMIAAAEGLPEVRCVLGGSPAALDGRIEPGKPNHSV